MFLITATSVAQAKASHASQQAIVIKLDQFEKGPWFQSEMEWHSACMALGLVNNLLATKKKPSVTLFLNLQGVFLADAMEPIENKQCGMMGSLDKLWNQFRKAGGKVMVCPGCAKIAGLEQDDLREGSVLGNHHSVGSLFLRANKVIDY